MNTPLLLALGALACSGVSDYVYKRAAMAGVAAHQLTMVQGWCYGLIVIGYGLVTGTLVFDLASLWGAVAGLFAYTGYYNFARCVQRGAVGTFSAIFRLSFVITVALAVIVLGERTSSLRLAGLALALVAVWLLLARAGEAARAEPATIVRVIIATVCLGIASFIYKVGMLAGATPAGLLVVQAGMVVGIGTANTLRLEGRIRPAPGAWHYGLRTAALLATAFTLLMEALSRGEASLVVPVNQMGFVVTAMLGVVWLKEPVDRRSLAGFASALGALACLATG